MKCFQHRGTDAIAVCAYCGRAVCPECQAEPSAKWVICSDKCRECLVQNEQALQAILSQSLRTARASAFYCYLCAGLSAGAAVVAWFMLPSTFLIVFTAGCAVVLLVSGLWYSRAARSRNLNISEG